MVGNASTRLTKRGILLEDIATLHYYREFITKSKGFLIHPRIRKEAPNCDFVLKVANNRQLALEFGLGLKKPDQLQYTMKNIKCDYGIIFSREKLRLYEDDNIVSVPLKYFFLV